MTNLLALITPTNLDTEHDKFFSSTTYNPSFHYIWENKNLNPTFSIPLKHNLWQAIKTQNHRDITRAAGQLFEVSITEDNLRQANEIAQVKGKTSEGTALEYCKLLQDGLEHFQLNDIQVELTDEPGFNSRPNHFQKKITVSKHIHFEYFSMEGGVHHELVHVIRYRNGKFNQIKRSDRFLPTEEGLASWCQDIANDDNGAAQHAIEYVASSVGITGSLRDIYECMVQLGMSRELAWKRAARHKFGFIDTAKEGDVLKPAMYFANEEKVAKLARDEKFRLFVGKINMDELANYPTYSGIWPVQQISEYFRL